jgi:arsenate reductase
MAEGWARYLKSDSIEAYSAGIETHGLNPFAVKVMSEAGVDILQQRSKHVDEFRDVVFDYVITVCNHAQETCPILPSGAKIVHAGFDDPPKMAELFDTEEEKLNCYRRVSDKIKDFIQTLPGALEEQ